MTLSLNRNVGGLDRIVRGVLAVVMAVIAAYWLLQSRPLVAGLSAVAAAGLAFNAVTCFCGINETLGIDTTD